MDHTTLDGHCHCGNVRYCLQTQQRLEDVIVRICGCAFCLRHRPRHWSDPHGSLAIEVAEPAEIILYRFGHGTADFVLCRRCGVYCFAIAEMDGCYRAVTNLNLALEGDARPRESALEALAEDPEARVRRRSANWTPVTGGWPPH
jgi:hypothetical protein